MQVQNMTPEMVTIGLTQPVYEALPLLIDAFLADLFANGVEVVVKATGKPVCPGHHHVMSE